MSDNKFVFITSKGKKYHFNSSCNYIKGKELDKIPLDEAKHSLEGPCSSCIHSMLKKEENKNIEEDKKENFYILDQKQSNSKKNNKKENNKNNKNNINKINDINKKNNQFEIINNESFQKENNLDEMTVDGIPIDNNQIKDNNNIFINNKNGIDNNVPFMDNDLSNIMPSNDKNDFSPRNSHKDIKKKNRKKNNINNENEKSNEKIALYFSIN